MAKISAHGSYKLAETVTREWEDISDGRRDHYSRTAYLLRSDGAILRKVSFRKLYSHGPAAFDSSMSIAATIKRTVPQSEYLRIFERYVTRRGFTVAQLVNETAL